MAHRPREARGPPAAARARDATSGAIDPEYLAGGAGRRDAHRDPRPGAGGAGHHHRRRDPPRELLEPLRARARRHRRRQPRLDARPHRQPDAGAARDRADPPPRAGARRRTPRFLRGEHRPHDQDHGARARSRWPSRRRTSTTAARRSARSRSPTRSARRSPTCSPPAPTSSSSTSRGWSRAPSRRARFGIETLRRALDGVARHDGAAHLLRLPVVHGQGPHERAYHFLPELAASPLDQISIETAQSGARPRGARAARGQDDHPRRDRAGHAPTSSRAETVAERIRRALPHKSPAGARRRAGLRHEVPAARRRVRQAAGAGRRRRAVRGRGGAPPSGRSRQPGNGLWARGQPSRRARAYGRPGSTREEREAMGDTRIKTTHVGSLIRPDDVIAIMRQAGQGRGGRSGRAPGGAGEGRARGRAPAEGGRGRHRQRRRVRQVLLELLRRQAPRRHRGAPARGRHVRRDADRGDGLGALRGVLRGVLPDRAGLREPRRRLRGGRRDHLRGRRGDPARHRQPQGGDGGRGRGGGLPAHRRAGERASRPSSTSTTARARPRCRRSRRRWARSTRRSWTRA